MFLLSSSAGGNLNAYLLTNTFPCGVQSIESILHPSQRISVSFYRPRRAWAKAYSEQRIRVYNAENETGKTSACQMSLLLNRGYHLGIKDRSSQRGTAQGREGS